MKVNRDVIVAVAFMMICSLSAKSLTLEDAVLKQNKPKGLGEMVSSIDGEFYFKLNDEMSKIEKISYRTGTLESTVFDSSTARDCSIKEWDGYIMSADESKILLYTNYEPIYRHSFKADYYVYDVRHNKLVKLTDAGGEEIATLSPDGRMVAYVKDNNVYIKKLDYGTTVQVTNNGKKNKIINGVPDWVYQEEFGMLNSLRWSPDNLTLAFLQWDESEVPMYNIPIYEGSCNPKSQYEIYPGNFQYKYPVAGEKNSKVGVISYDVETRALKTMSLPIDEEDYIPDIKFANSADRLMVTTLNRAQNKLRIFSVNPRSKVAKLAYSENSDTWIDSDFAEKANYLDGSFVILSEKDGYTHLYQYSYSGALIKQLTFGEWNVTDYYGYDPLQRTHYIQTTQNGPLNRVLAKVDSKGTVTAMTKGDGTYSAKFNHTYTYYVQNFSSAKMPNQYVLFNSKGKSIREVETNIDYRNKYVVSDIPVKEFFQMQSDGVTLNGYMIKPVNFDPAKKYPVIMSQYSGPGSQEVKNQWGMDWTYYFATQGYIVACVDGRGTGARGKKFQSLVYMNLGKYETKDQLAAARYMATLNYVDSSKIGIWGWSYGGYETLMAMSQPNSLYKAGVAIAPVTDWRFYDSIYAERYMRTPNENVGGYKESSPLNKVNEQKGKLLMICGTADDNVHIANTLQYSAEMTAQNKLLEMMFFTNMNHSINGCDVRLPLFHKVLDFYDRNLK